jgi:gliding motility-associated-like protein
MKICRLIVFVCLNLLIGQINAQDFSNKGKDFWIPYPGHIDGTISRMALYISSTENTTGEVQLAGQIIPFTVVANQATSVQISPVTYNVYNAQADGIGTQKGIHVVSQKPVVVYAHVLNAARSGSTLVFPTSVLGKEYIALSFNQSSNGRSQITVVATEDNTTVEFNLKYQSSGTPIRAANTPFQIPLNKGDVYQIQSLTDLTGSTIRSISSGAASCKPIGVFTGSSWTSFDCVGASGGDNLFQQVFPSNAWGRNYITAPFANRQSDIYRIIVKDPTTQVTLNGSILPVNTLILNSYYQIKNSQPNIITSDKPILVVQYMTSQTCDTRNVPTVLYPGDPEIITINPLEQTINNVSVVSARNNLTPPNTNITAHYLNILMKTANTGSLKIDGAAPIASWITIPNSEYSYIQENVTGSTNSNPSHNIKADSGFIALAYGMGNVESYGYNAGTNIVDLNPPVSIQNEFSASNISYSATCSNSPFKVNLALTYQPEKIVLDYNGTAGLSGPQQFTYVPTVNTITPNKYDSTYVSNGKTYYLYRVPQSYTFTTAGNYPVKITTTTTLPQSDGCSNTNDQEITDNIIVNAPPTADFNIVSNGCVNNAIALTDLSDGVGRNIVRWLWEFSDGTSSTVQNPSITFTTPNNYTAKLTSITDFGCIAQVTKPINVSAKPVSLFTVPALRCEKGDIVYTDGSTIAAGAANNTIVRYTWNLDNGSPTDTLTTPTARNTNYTSWGNKNVFLVTASNTGCISDTFRIPGFKINPLPEVGFVIPEVCLADANAPFQDTSKIADGSEASFTYAWKLNDGSPAISPGPTFTPAMLTLKNPAPKYNTVGNYTVSLTVTSNNNCVASLSSPFTVNGSIPNASFSVQMANPLCSNDSIRIINTSTVDFGNITRMDVYWDTIGAPSIFVRDENPSLNNNYANLYTAFANPATQKVGIKITAYSGNSSVCRKSIRQEVILLNAPKASFTDIRDICYDAAPRQLTQGSFVSAVAGTAIYSGKGITAAGLLNPVTTGVGNDTIKYFVQNTHGCKDSAFQPITVWPSPVAKWGVQSILCEKNDLAFTDSSVANFSKIVARNWIFGDGNSLTNTAAGAFNKRYTTAQTYTAGLQVITDSGCISSVNQQTIKVNPLPIPAFSLPSICLPDGRGTFTNQSTIADNSEALFSYSWNFGDPNDPSSSTLREPTHKYTALGPVNVQLKITSKDACVDSLTKSLTTIYPWPKASFSATPLEVCVGDAIQFRDLGDLINSGATVSWNWDLSGGTNSTLQNPTKVFADSGIFAIKYFFYNTNGCVSDTVSKNITVHPYPKLTMVSKINVLEGGNLKIVPKYVYGTNLTYQWTPPTYLNNDTDSTPITTPLADIRYRLFLTGIGACTVSDTVFIKVLLSPIVPNAFSPNGDGINDRWRIQYLESYPGATVDVFNRYGQAVFSSIGYDLDWDGTVNGKALPIGTYYYIINPKNGRKIITGSITIIR